MEPKCLALRWRHGNDRKGNVKAVTCNAQRGVLPGGRPVPCPSGLCGSPGSGSSQALPDLLLSASPACLPQLGLITHLTPGCEALTTLTAATELTLRLSPNLLPTSHF